MRIILREDVASLGKSGDLVTVKDGYGRNYLLPQGLGMLATEHNVKQIEHQKKVIAARNAKLAKDAQAVADKISSLEVTIKRQAGEGDRLFGSITAQDVADALAAKGQAVDKRKIELEHPIKTIGQHTVPVRLHPDVIAEVRVTVAAE